jgi:hypothetical protein
MTDHCRRGNDLKLSARVLIGVMSKLLSRGAQNNHKNPQAIGSVNWHKCEILNEKT